jgi:hypothetical protein
MKAGFIAGLAVGLLMTAFSVGSGPSAPVLSATFSGGTAHVQWTGEGGVNYELKDSPDVYFTNTSRSQYFLGRNGTVVSERPLEGNAGFWKVRTLGASNGVCIAQSGEHAGKLVRYDDAGNPALLHAFGVNYYDAFLRYIGDVNDTSFVEGFEYLRDHNIPVARVLAAGFWPINWNLYFSDKDEYFRRLDYFVSQAERCGIGLILDLFWSSATVGEIVDDAVAAGILVSGVDFAPPVPLNLDRYGHPTYAEYKRALGRPDSGSNAFITYFTHELVSRYAHSPAIWGWEFGNEYNLSVDHPNLQAMRTRPGGPANQGMLLPSTSTNMTLLPAWTGPDDLVRADVLVAKENFANTVRSIDTWRLIMSGDAVPRTSAYHNWTEHTWTKDSRAQMAQVLPVDNPAPINTVTVHIYPGNPGDSPQIYFSDNPVTNQWLTGQYKELFDYFVAESAAIGHPLIVGEWGASGDGTTDDEKTTFSRMMQALIDSNVQLSLLWDFDTRNVNGKDQWWIHTGQIEGWPATPKLYMITNDNPDFWDLEQANLYFQLQQ